MQTFACIFAKAKVYLWFLLLLLAVGVWIFLQDFRITRLFFLLAVPFLWLSGVILLRKRKAISLTVLVIGLIALAFLLLPGRSANPEQLRALYIQSLKQYEGSPYIWGGEARSGIDCSGLVRRGLINADFNLGLRTFNPHLLREAFNLWWHDCSAKALLEGYRGFTRPLFKVESINAIADPSLQPGDIAVTSSGDHTLAYLGDHTWIEADPGDKVIIVTTPSDNPWFKRPVQILRWRQFED